MSNKDIKYQCQECKQVIPKGEAAKRKYYAFNGYYHEECLTKMEEESKKSNKRWAYFVGYPFAFLLTAFLLYYIMKNK